MNEDQNFDLRNALNAEKAQLMSSLSANTSPIGDWKIMKIYEARMKGEADPYNFEELTAQRQAARERISDINIELDRLDGKEPTTAELLAVAKSKKQTEITEYDNSANVHHRWPAYVAQLRASFTPESFLGGYRGRRWREHD